MGLPRSRVPGAVCIALLFIHSGATFPTLAQQSGEAPRATSDLHVRTANGEALQTVAAHDQDDRGFCYAVLHGAPMVFLCRFVPGSGQVAYHRIAGGPHAIYVMSQDGSDPICLSRPGCRDEWPDWSPDGQSIAFVSVRDGNPEIYTMRADGTDQRRLTDDPVDDGSPDWSPDGRLIAYHTNTDGSTDIFVMAADGSGKRQVTSDPGVECDPDWSPDGTMIAYKYKRGGVEDIHVVNADGTNPRNLTRSPHPDLFPAWSPDGTRIAYTSVLGGNWEICVMNADGSDQRRLTNSPGHDARPAWSPDGTQIVFDSDRAGHFDLYVMNADGSDVRALTDDAANDHCPTWRAGTSTVARCYLGPPAYDGGWDPSLGVGTPLLVVARVGQALTTVAALRLAEEAWEAVTCEAVEQVGPDLLALRIEGRGLQALVEDVARGLAPRVWALPDAPPTTGMVVFLDRRTGRIASIVASHDEACELDVVDEAAIGRIAIGGRPTAAYDATAPGTNLVSGEVRQVQVDRACGAVTLVE